MASVRATTEGGKSAGCGHTGQPTGDIQDQTAMDGKGRARIYDLLVPSSYDPNKPLALVFAYHAAGSDEKGGRGYGIQEVDGALAAAVFVYPRGIDYQSQGTGWDDACRGYDIPFFDNMLSAVEAKYCIDTKRVFAAGFSRGGDHVTALTCCRGDKVRAVAAASCTDEYGNASDYQTYTNLPCPTKGTTGIRFTHDASGGDTGYPKPLFTTTAALFRSFNGCSASTATVDANCKSYDGCTSPLVECSYVGLGHVPPNGWAKDTWTFFSGFN
jgi:poly(3-hydroxybutyrate) depolymerase